MTCTAGSSVSNYRTLQARTDLHEGNSNGLVRCREGLLSGRPLPHGEMDKFYASKKHMDVSNVGDMAEMTPRQRKRALKIFGSGE